MAVIGIDLGGTKTAVIRAEDMDGGVRIEKAGVFPTVHDAPAEQCPYLTLDRALELVERLRTTSCTPITRIGVACGGPLDEERGIIMRPPNLPEWDDFPVVRYIEDRTGIETVLRNDANACALAEWRYGAGKGCSDVIFLTFGTGFGAGVISGGRLISGSSGAAGEIGHVKASPDPYGINPIGYGVAGGFEGYCSGGGIKQIAAFFAEKALKEGRPAAFCPTRDALGQITAKAVADAAKSGDETALEIFRLSATYLGEACAVLCDLFNPERIIVGGIYTRCVGIMESCAKAEFRRRALPSSADRCEIVPSALGEEVGDYSCVAAANALGM